MSQYKKRLSFGWNRVASGNTQDNKSSMTKLDSDFMAEAAARSAREWVQVLAKYRDPSTARSIWELTLTFGIFIALWAVSLWALSYSWLLAVPVTLVNGAFLVRLFAIQHDCGHMAYFKDRRANDWVGRVLGVFTLTPYDVWKRAHSIHHSSHGNLDRRGMGDIDTLTVDEYYARSRMGRIAYRLYRNPLVLFGLGPAYMFVLSNRFPVGLTRAGWIYWASAIGTDIAIFASLAAMVWLGGWLVIFVIWLPTCVAAATYGVWLFYVQHQFETTHWDHETDWKLHDAALLGSSHYVLPAPLQWVTANIGVHHVHHLYSRIPFYRLTEVLRDFPVLAEAQKMTLRQSFVNVRLHLWDEQSRRLLSYAQAAKLRQS